MICPLRSPGLVAGELLDCKKESCAWWVFGLEACALTVLAVKTKGGYYIGENSKDRGE